MDEGSVYCASEKILVFSAKCRRKQLRSGLIFVSFGGAESASGALHHVKGTLCENYFSIFCVMLTVLQSFFCVHNPELTSDVSRKTYS